MIIIKYLKKLSTIEALRFVIGGTFNTIFCYLIFTALLVFDFEPALAMTIATLITIPISFYVMGRLVFSIELSIKRSILFLVMQSAGYIINISILLLVSRAGASDYISGVISLGTTAFVMFFISKFWVFHKPIKTGNF
jgi:putative flippase GtrA